MKIFLHFRLICLAAIIFSLAPHSSAHEFDSDFKFARLWSNKNDNHIKAIIEDTSQGYEIRCAVYDVNGRVLGVWSEKSGDLATDFFFFLSEEMRLKDVVAHKCLDNSKSSSRQKHEVFDQNLSTINKEDKYNSVDLIIANTHYGYRMRCALYDENGSVLAVQSLDTKELATSFYLTLPTGYGRDDVKSHRCVTTE